MKRVTMLCAALAKGERGGRFEWVGLLLAAVGLVWLTWPGLSAPTPTGAALMAIAGAAWGFYSLRGRNSQDALGDTKGNFVRTLPIVGLLLAATMGSFQVTVRGAGWAALSGAASSGLGYVAWYSALRGLTAMRAALVQLTVPIIAAIGGIVFLDEYVTFRLLVSSLLILGGIALALFRGRRCA